MESQTLIPEEIEYPPSDEAWKWHIKHSIKSINDLKKYFDLNQEETEQLKDVNLPIRITPYYARITQHSKALRKCMIPSSKELIHSLGESIDPLGEEHDSHSCIVHRYPDRCLFIATTFCSSVCRYCTRARKITNGQNKTNWEQGLDYIKEHTEIRDVLISGGDPLTMEDKDLEFLISSIRDIKHVEIIRIGTKVPVVLPQRITDNLCNILKKYHPIFMSIHWTHPDEVTELSRQACIKLADAGIPLGSQTVLLKDVNDKPEIMQDLMKKLLTIRVRPYYIYMMDKIYGGGHFRTTIDKGIEIIQSLRGWVTGYGVPSFIVDSNMGKIPINPDYIVSKNKIDNGFKYIFKNYKNEEITYEDFY